MSKSLQYDRRRFLTTAAVTIAAAPFAAIGTADAQNKNDNPANISRGKEKNMNTFETIKQVNAGVLNVGYAELGPAEGIPVILLHGWPYDIHSYIDVAPLLAAKGCRVIVPHLRGHGTTTFLSADTSRSGQQASIGADLIALMDALKIPRAVLAGYDWGGRAACVVAALWPDRCMGLVSVNGYLVQDIARASQPISAKTEAGFWYQYYFLTERGRAGLTANRQDIANIMWARNSPTWHFSPEEFDRSAIAFDNPDYVDVVIHSYRHRLGAVQGASEYEHLEKKLAAQPVINVPAITMDGDSDGVVPATDGKSTAAKFGVDRQHRIVRNAGHNLPQENPKVFADAVWEIASGKK